MVAAIWLFADVARYADLGHTLWPCVYFQIVL